MVCCQKEPGPGSSGYPSARLIIFSRPLRCVRFVPACFYTFTSEQHRIGPFDFAAAHMVSPPPLPFARMYMLVPQEVLVQRKLLSKLHPVAFPTPASISACEHIRPPSFKHFRSASGWFFQVKHLSSPFLKALSDSPQALPTTVQPRVAQFLRSDRKGNVVLVVAGRTVVAARLTSEQHRTGYDFLGFLHFRSDGMPPPPMPT